MSLGIAKIRGIGTVDLDALDSHVRGGGRLGVFAHRIGVCEQTVRVICQRHSIPTKVYRNTVLTDKDCAWIAACIDCEGTISAYAKPSRNGRSGRSVSVIIKIVMTSSKIINRLHDLCGGAISGPSKTRMPQHKPVYSWSLGPYACRWLIPQILPYLLIKSQQAECIQKILNENKQGHSMPNFRLVPLINKIRLLNQRGYMNRLCDLSELREAFDTAPVHSIICACGCGISLAGRDSRGRERHFIHGHNSRKYSK